jgi:hypothetical protein
MNGPDRESVQSKPGMAVETKMGMGIVIILVCAFGFLVYHKFDLKQRALLQASMQGNQPDSDTPAVDGAKTPSADADSSSPQVISEFRAPETTPAAASKFGSDKDPIALAATESRPAFEFTEPTPDEPQPNQASDITAAQTASSDPFATLAAQNAARVAQEEQAARATFDDPFASIPTPAPEPRKLFATTPPAGEPASPTVAQTSDAPTFPTFGDTEESVAAAESTSLPATADLTQPTTVSSPVPAEAIDPPAFDRLGSDTFVSSGTSPATPSESSTQPRPLPPAFPDVDSGGYTADASQGRDLPPVSTVDSPPFGQGTGSGEAAPPLRPVNNSSRQLIAMLEPLPEVSAFNDARPVTKPAPALFSVSDEQPAAPTAQNVPVSQFDTTDTPSGNQPQPAGSSQQSVQQNVTAARGTAEVEVGVARFHKPRQIQQVAGASDPCEICDVKVNDNYWTISKRTYGTARYFSSLALYNQHRIPDPKKLRPGMKVLIPAASVLEERYPEFFRGQQRKAAQPSGYFLKPNGTPAYRVGERETLSEISQKHLGRASRWIQIYRLNQQTLKDPNKLKLGTVIVLPDDATDVHLAP